MFNDLLIQRSNYLGYKLTMQENDNHGWVGGSAPQWFEDKEHLLTDESQLKYGFFLSVKLPVSNHMVSIFIPELAEAYQISKTVRLFFTRSEESLYRTARHV